MRASAQTSSAAAADIRLYPSWRKHEKRAVLQDRLGAEGALAIVDLWLYACDSRSSGDLTGKTDDMIEIAAGWPKERRGQLVPVLVEIGLLDGEAGARRLHDWPEHQPNAVKAFKYRLDGAFGGLKGKHPSWTDDQIIREVAKRESMSPADVRKNLDRYAPAPAAAHRRSRPKQNASKPPFDPPSTPPSSPSVPSVPSSLPHAAAPEEGNGSARVFSPGLESEVGAIEAAALDSFEFTSGLRDRVREWLRGHTGDSPKALEHALWAAGEAARVAGLVNSPSGVFVALLQTRAVGDRREWIPVVGEKRVMAHPAKRAGRRERHPSLAFDA